MKRSLLGAVAAVLIGVGPAARLALGQAVMTVVPVGSNQVQQGQTITLEVFLSGLTQGIRAYECKFGVTPLAGSTGGATGLVLADPTIPGQGGIPANTSLFINEPGWNQSLPPDPDWVFAPPLPPNYLFLFAVVNVPDNLVTATMGSGLVGPFATPKYLGTIILRASGTASGNFSVNLVGVNQDGGTYLRGAVTGVDLPLSVVGATVTVIPPGPTNDNCANATTLNNGVTNFTTISALTDGPAISSSCDEGPAGSIVNDVWFDYTAPCTGIATISTCNSASFDNRIAVYDGDGVPACSCPSLGSPLVTCDDDAPGCSSTAEVVFAATQGLCYKVRVGGDSSAGTNTGTGSISASCIDNDTCATAKLVSAPYQPQFGSTRNTNPESGLPTCGPYGSTTAAGAVWYRVTGTGNLMTASLCGQTTYNSRLSVFSGSCGALTCVNAVDNNCGIPNTNNETISWCSTGGPTPPQYYILVHGGTGATGDFRLVVSDGSCVDTNLCTADSCVGTVCQHVDSTPATHCCAPATGALNPINDNNVCTIDVCNADGSVSRNPVPNGPNLACDDGLRCTLDQCLTGACANTDINAIPCTVPGDCPSGVGSTCVGSFCRCIENPTLDLIPDPGALPNPSCYSIGNLITINIEMGFSPSPISAAQMFLEYDPSTLQFVSMVPGRIHDSASPFSFALSPPINNPVSGTLDYAVGIPPGGTGTAQPALVAVATFQTINECDTFVRFRAHNPPTALLDAQATLYLPITSNLPPTLINGSLPVINGCPSNMTVGFDTDEFTATVPFVLPTAMDTCDGPVPVTCNPAPGSDIGAGTTSVTCTAENSCGVAEACGFDVTVQPSTLTMDLQLSPTVVAAPFTRCITLDLWDCPSGRHQTVSDEVTFSNGISPSVGIDIPGGLWSCVTARDKLHTLRSKAPNPLSSIDGRTYQTDFVGDWEIGGHWLLVGNLNDDGFIDIQDYVRFLQQYLLAFPNRDTNCSTLGYHADLNGNGAVDVADLSFIQVSMFQMAEPACCGGTVASDAEWEAMKSSISISELREQGLGHLGLADLNGDDVLDETDLDLFVQLKPTFDSIKPQPREPVDRQARPLSREDNAGHTGSLTNGAKQHKR